MTDAEIRKQLAEAESKGRAVALDSPDDGPPLIMVLKRRLTLPALESLLADWKTAWDGEKRGPCPRMIIIEPEMELFQLVDGEWRKLS